jgi:hypothetical protein
VHAYTTRIRKVKSMNFMSSSVLLESWDLGLFLLVFTLLGAVAGAVGGGLAFARAKEQLRQRLVLGALAGALISWVVALPHYVRNPTSLVFWCIVSGYAGADGISILLKAIGRGK